MDEDELTVFGNMLLPSRAAVFIVPLTYLKLACDSLFWYYLNWRGAIGNCWGAGGFVEMKSAAERTEKVEKGQIILPGPLPKS